MTPTAPMNLTSADDRTNPEFAASVMELICLSLMCQVRTPKVAIQFDSRHDARMKLLFIELRWVATTLRG